MPSARWQQHSCIFFKRHFNMHTTGWDWILTPRGIYQGLVWKLFVLFLWFWWTDPLMSTKIWKQKKFLLVSTFGSISFQPFWDKVVLKRRRCVWHLHHHVFSSLIPPPLRVSACEALLMKVQEVFFVLFFVSNDSTGALWVCVVWGYWS